MFLSSHLLHKVEQVCKRVLILNKGRVIAQGRVGELLRQAHAVELRIDHPDQAAQVLGQLAWVQGVSQEEDRRRVQAPLERALELLAAQQMFPFEVRPLVSSLEHVFLELTDEHTGEADV